MTKKTTINKIISSKAFWIIISLLGSFLLWMYIMSTEETTIEKTSKPTASRGSCASFGSSPPKISR